VTALPVIRSLSPGETAELLEWAAAEGWNPGVDDAAAFHVADPDGFIGCFVDGRMTAGISAVRYGADYGFIGLYIAHPDFRGWGYGRMVWDAGMAHLEGRTIGLDGVPEQQANYRSMGFLPAYETSRWSGSLASDGAAFAQVEAFDDVYAADVYLADVKAYDRDIFPAGRSAFLDTWLQPPRIARVVMSAGRVAGYAVCRRCRDGYKIGPLFADGLTEARLLLQACATAAGDAPLHIDVPEIQAEFIAMLEMLGFARGFVTARMYRGTPPPSTFPSQVFGITTLELG
jgi:GNAT superfamily N-acetyltransferase